MASPHFLEAPEQAGQRRQIMRFHHDSHVQFNWRWAWACLPECPLMSLPSLEDSSMRNVHLGL